MYFQKIALWVSQYLLLEMRNLLAGQVMYFSHILKGKFYRVHLQSCLMLEGASWGSFHIKEWGDTSHDWVSTSRSRETPHDWVSTSRSGEMPQDWMSTLRKEGDASKPSVASYLIV